MKEQWHNDLFKESRYAGVERHVDALRKMIAHLTQGPIPNPLISVAVQLIDIFEDVVQRSTINRSPLQFGFHQSASLTHLGSVKLLSRIV